MIEDLGQWADPNATFICGVDEVGRGSLAGPVVASAVMLPKNLIIPGVDDSKKLSPQKRKELFPKILESAITVGVGFVDSIKIDEWGINYAVVEAMYRAILTLSVVPDWVLVDGFLIPHLPISQTAIKGGDAICHLIGAASIVAKVLRDRAMELFDIIYPQYGFSKHKGYGTAEHINNIKRFGPSLIHRKTFKPINEF
ncbi:MAG: ribonuclease HII [Candidatus Stahlbacteria bacterium]|jgi:ribonuclease HII|nr:ribonuclease HII [candidate division WOR-3 bacterium]TET99098.1 MAG: ribonuclease HII [Candidatus Stahlbacteria bacterium]